MSAINFQQNTNHAVLTFCLGLPAQLNLIRMIKKEMDRSWEGMRNPDSRAHLIDGLGFSTLKTDAIKDYVERISRVVFDSKGGWQRGFTSKQVSEKHDLLAATLGRLNTQELNHNTLFIELMTALFGYDARLVSAALASSNADEAKFAVAYLNTRFDLVAESFDGKLEEDPFAGMYNENFVKYLTEYSAELYLKMTSQLDQNEYQFFRTILFTSKQIES